MIRAASRLGTHCHYPTLTCYPPWALGASKIERTRHISSSLAPRGLTRQRQAAGRYVQRGSVCSSHPSEQPSFRRSDQQASLLCPSYPNPAQLHAGLHTGYSANNSVPDLPVVYHPAYSAPSLPHGHRFPMGVFRRIYERLLSKGIINTSQVYVPSEDITDGQLALVHSPAYLEAFNSGRLDAQQLRRIGFGEMSNSEAVKVRSRAEVAGTLLTARLALKHGLAVNTAGGTHHAFPDFGSGFCILNDLAVTTEVLLSERLVKQVLILDLDVHQGDGTAFVFRGRPDVFTLSFHCQSNFPSRKQESTLDVGLPDGTGDSRFLEKLGDILPRVLSSFKPDLVLYDAGVDVHAADNLGRFCISDEGLMRRELMVLDTCLAERIPVAGYVGGGYDDDLDVLADRHICLHKAAIQMWMNYSLGSTLAAS